MGRCSMRADREFRPDVTTSGAAALFSRALILARMAIRGRPHQITTDPFGNKLCFVAADTLFTVGLLN
jgi:hypothetical protein